MQKVLVCCVDDCRRHASYYNNRRGDTHLGLCDVHRRRLDTNVDRISGVLSMCLPDMTLSLIDIISQYATEGPVILAPNSEEKSVTIITMVI